MLLSLATLAASPFLLASSPLADIYVDASAGGCATGTGALNDPVCSITAAIAIASPGDVIRIEPGTYVESISLPFDLDLVGTSGAELTIVDANEAGRVLTVPAAVTATVDGLTLTNGRAIEAGGVHCLGDLTITNSTVSNNRTVVAPYEDARGGGIMIDGGTLALEHSTVSGNTANGSFGSGQGGGILVDGGMATLENSTITGNAARSISNFGRGGGVLVESGTLTIDGCIINDNGASAFQSQSAYGGGVMSLNSAVNIVDSTLSENSASSGGGIRSQGGSLLISGSTISENGALLFGGGISALEGLFQLTNSTVTSNNARSAGGVRVLNPQLGSRIANSTITLNAGFESRGGLANGGPSLQPLDLLNSIVAGNTIGSPGPLAHTVDVDGSFNSLGHNLIGIGDTLFTDGLNGDQVGSFASPLDPKLSPLQDNGGPTLTHEPFPGSPAINAGDPLQFELLDQRGLPRPLSASPDIGAVESDGAFVDLCFGNGGVQHPCTNCPCINNASPSSTGGCLNSAGTSAKLEASGLTSVSLPPGVATDLRFGMSGVVPSAFCILNSGDSVAPNNMANPCFGLDSGVQSTHFDGLRCAVVNTRRHGGRFSDPNGEVGVTNAPWGGESNPNVGIAVAGAGFVAGQTRFFQVIHREDPLLSCMRGLNTSQAVMVVFAP